MKPRLSISKRQEGIELCIRNAEIYLQCAKALVNIDGRVAYLLLIYSNEEIGKIPLIANAAANRYATIDKWKKWQQRFRNHSVKLMYNNSMNENSIKKFFQAMASTRSDKKTLNTILKEMNTHKELGKIKAEKKNKIAYVDFVGGSFKAPSKVAIKEVKEGIRELEEQLILMNLMHKDSRSLKYIDLVNSQVDSKLHPTL